MKRRVIWVISSIAMLAILGGAMTLSHPQSMAERKSLLEPPQGVGSPDDRTDFTAQFESEILAFERKLVKGTPFSATLLIEQITERSSETRARTSLIYRDAEGRIRRDQMRANSADTPETTTINDPISGFSYVLQHLDKTVRRTKLNSHTEEKPQDSIAVMRNAIAAQQRAGSYQMLPVPASNGSPGDLKPGKASVVAGGTNSGALGEKEIGGVTTEGTRTIVTIPAGAIGNERAVEIVSERWYSPTLMSVVLIERFDPRSGRSTYRLTGIRSVEPPATLFMVPNDYKIIVE